VTAKTTAAVLETPRPVPTGLLEVEGLTRDFGGLRAVDDCTFTVTPGTITSLVGPNGAGKTTVFNLVSGLLSPSGGSIRFDGQELVGLPSHRIIRSGIGRTFQITRELGELTVLENVIVNAPTHGLRAILRSSVLHHERERALELLELVGLTRVAHELAKSLSYGQRKLLELAAVLMAEPRLVMLDEPAGGVNPRLIEDLMDLVGRLNGEGVTFLVVEHNMDVVMDMSDSIVVMAAGKVVVQGTPDEVQSNDEVLDAYLGRE
jgi:branched-chain amino acid transport system ATP-binding protein